jgi:hypothetical protein
MTVGMDYCVLNFWKYSNPNIRLKIMLDIYYRAFLFFMKNSEKLIQEKY